MADTGRKNRLFERKEVKYLLSLEQQQALIHSFGTRMIRDDYGEYDICNIYMDTPDFRLIRRSLEKPVYKEKLRIRSYGTVDKDHPVFLELKKKYKGIVYKRRIKMALGDAMDFLTHENDKSGQIENEISYFLKHYNGIQSAMFISYHRIAFRGKDDADLRITFDNNILWREEDVSLSSEIYGNRILNKDQCLMEIKAPGVLPLWLTRALKEVVFLNKKVSLATIPCRCRNVLLLESKQMPGR